MVQPPSKTASRANKSRAGASSSSKLQSIVAQSVWWRAGASRGPPTASSSRRWQVAQQLTRRELSHARGDQLDRERQAIEQAAERGDGGRRLEVALDGARPRDEQFDRLVLDERRHGELVLAVDAERVPARDEQTEPGRCGEQRAERGGCGVDLLEVVHEQERRPLAEMLGERLGGRACPVLHPERRHDLGRDELGVTQSGQTDEHDTVRERSPRAHGRPGARRASSRFRPAPSA